MIGTLFAARRPLAAQLEEYFPPGRKNKRKKERDRTYVTGAQVTSQSKTFNFYYFFVFIFILILLVVILIVLTNQITSRLRGIKINFFPRRTPGILPEAPESQACRIPEALWARGLLPNSSDQYRLFKIYHYYSNILDMRLWPWGSKLTLRIWNMSAESILDRNRKKIKIKNMSSVLKENENVTRRNSMFSPVTDFLFGKPLAVTIIFTLWKCLTQIMSHNLWLIIYDSWNHWVRPVKVHFGRV